MDTELTGMYDTVALTLPTAAGADVQLFADIMRKGRAYSNFRRPHSLATGWELKLAQIRARILHWSGDRLPDALFENIELNISVNERCVLTVPLSSFLSGASVPIYESVTPACLNDNDHIDGFLRIGQTPPWDPPTKHVAERLEYKTYEAIAYPAPLRRIAQALSLPLPRREKTQTQYRDVQRPMRGVYLVRVHLEGILTHRAVG